MHIQFLHSSKLTNIPSISIKFYVVLLLLSIGLKGTSQTYGLEDVINVNSHVTSPRIHLNSGIFEIQADGSQVGFPFLISSTYGTRLNSFFSLSDNINSTGTALMISGLFETESHDTVPFPIFQSGNGIVGSGYTGLINGTTQSFYPFYNNFHDGLSTFITDGEGIYQNLVALPHQFAYFGNGKAGMAQAALNYSQDNFTVAFPKMQPGGAYNTADGFNFNNDGSFYCTSSTVDNLGYTSTYTRFAVGNWSLNYNSKLQNLDGTYVDYMPFWASPSGAGFGVSYYNYQTGTHTATGGTGMGNDGSTWFYAYGYENPDGSRSLMNTADITPQYAYFNLDHQQTSGYHTSYNAFEVSHSSSYFTGVLANSDGSDTYFNQYWTGNDGSTYFGSAYSPNSDGNYITMNPLYWNNTGKTQFSSWNGLTTESGGGAVPRLIIDADHIVAQNAMPNSILNITDSTEYDTDTTAILNIQSSKKGVLLPRLTNDQIQAIPTSNLQSGFIVYNSDNHAFTYYNGNQWLQLAPSGAGSTLGWGFNGNANTMPEFNFIGTTDERPLAIRTFNEERMRIDANGNVGIGTIKTNDNNYRLFVEKGIHTRRVKIDQDTWSDFVFDKDYKLPTLQEVENYIKINSHLKDIPSAEEVKKNGINVGDNQAALLQKIEELTLYIIEQDKKTTDLKAQLDELKKVVVTKQ